MKLSFMSLILAFLLLTACRLPDDVGVGANGSRYDYLGASQQWPLTNDQGEGFGLNVWASWSLSPKKFVMVAPERNYNPFDNPNSNPIVINNGSDSPIEDTLGDQVKDISSITKDMSGLELTFWITIMGILSLTTIVVLPKAIGHFKNKQAK